MRVDVVRASSKGRGQGANLNIPARIYEALGRPSVFALYLDGRGRILLEPLRILGEARPLPGEYAAALEKRLKAGAQEAVALLPTEFKERLRGLGAPAVRVALRRLLHDETLALVEGGGGSEYYRLPLGMEEALGEVLEALGVEGEPPQRIPEGPDAVVLVEVDGLRARLYFTRP